MQHRMQFLDRAGHVINEMHVDAKSDMDAFRMAADVWPTGANRVRMLSVSRADGCAARRPIHSSFDLGSNGEALSG